MYENLYEYGLKLGVKVFELATLNDKYTLKIIKMQMYGLCVCVGVCGHIRGFLYFFSLEMSHHVQ